MESPVVYLRPLEMSVRSSPRRCSSLTEIFGHVENSDIGTLALQTQKNMEMT